MTRTTISLTAGVLALALVVGALLAIRHGSSDDEVTAYFTDVTSLIPGNTVKANGVEVGSVDSVTLDHGLAKVEMKLDKSVLPLHSDASAKIRPVSLLGEQYVSLDTGTPGKPALTGAIPVSHTSAAVGLDQVLNTFDTPTSTALGALVTTLGEGIEGNGGNVADVIKALAPTLQNTDQLLQVIDSQNSVLDQLIDEASPVASAIAADDGKSVNRLVASAQQVLGAVSGQQDSLKTALASLPQTLADTRRTLDQLTGVADSATPTLKAARPVTDNLAAISTELDSFASAGQPALDSLQPVLERADTLLDQARPIAAELRTGAPHLRSVAKGARTVGVPALDNLGSLLKFVTGWAMATAGYDGLGHFFRGAIPIDSNTLKLLAPDLLTNPLAPPVKAKDPAKGSGKPKGGITLPTLPNVPGLGGLNGVVGGVTGGLNGLLGATGLSQNQEQGLLGQLLGGGS